MTSTAASSLVKRILLQVEQLGSTGTSLGTTDLMEIATSTSSASWTSRLQRIHQLLVPIVESGDLSQLISCLKQHKKLIGVHKSVEILKRLRKEMGETPETLASTSPEAVQPSARQRPYLSRSSKRKRQDSV